MIILSCKSQQKHLKKQFNCLGENTEKYIIFSVPIEKEFIRKTVKLNPTYYNLLIAQDLQEAHYQILLITLLKKFIELNVNIKHDNEKCGTCGIKYKNCECFLEYINFKDNLIKYNCLCCNNNYQKNNENLMKT